MYSSSISEGAPSGMALVVGAAHIDVLAQVTGDEYAVDKIGQVFMEVGGTACNIAINLAQLKTPCRLLTAMTSGSPYMPIISSHLTVHGVDVQVVTRDHLPEAVFSAHIGKDGEMVSAVSSMPIEKVVFTDEEIEAAFQGACCVVLECNLSQNMINRLATTAHNKQLPLFVAAVSEEKSLRLMDIAAPIDIVFMNKREASFFSRSVLHSNSPHVVSEYLNGNMIVTCGKDGAKVITPANGEEYHFPAVPVDSGNINTLGAGDALLSSVVSHYVFRKTPLPEATQIGIQFAADVIKHSNCNAGKNRSIEKALLLLGQKAQRDIMTGMLNRASGESFLEHSVRLATANDNGRFAVLMLDIDHFKKVNDTFGHDAGDKAIKAVADIINGTVRDSDAACRWGGEEFLCVLRGADEVIAGVVAERIRAKVEEALIPQVGHITVSVGVAYFCANSTAEEVVKLADNALYEAKHNGRNRVCSADITKVG